MDAAPGWHGKLPALGDFAHRRLPQGFIDSWDDWLQECLQASRAMLGQDWLTHFLGAPVWRFLLLPGALDAECRAGVLLSSVDRVGRHFPLTVCASLPAGAPFGNSLAALERWLAELESCALLGLDAERGLLRLETALQGLRLPDCAAGTSVQSGFLDGLAARLLPPLLAGESLWWCCGPDTGCTGFRCPGLPPPQAFAAMLRGRPPVAPDQTWSADAKAIDRSTPA